MPKNRYAPANDKILQTQNEGFTFDILAISSGPTRQRAKPSQDATNILMHRQVLHVRRSLTEYLRKEYDIPSMTQRQSVQALLYSKGHKLSLLGAQRIERAPALMSNDNYMMVRLHGSQKDWQDLR